MNILQEIISYHRTLFSNLAVGMMKNIKECVLIVGGMTKPKPKKNAKRRQSDIKLIWN